MTTIKCPLCQRDCDDSVLQLHEIVGRYLIGNVEEEMLLPISLHMLICRDCNMSIADTDEARLDLFKYSAQLWTPVRVLEEVRAFNRARDIVLPPYIVPYQWLKEQINNG